MGRMKKKYMRKNSPSDGFALLTVLLICFLCSGLGGCLLVAGSGEKADASLSSYLHNYLALLSDGLAVSPSVWSVFWEVCFWPLLVLVFGFTALGILVIPIVFCIRGFLLSYAISSFFQVFGPSCMPTVLAVFGVTTLISIPVLFAVGHVGLAAAADLVGGVSRERVPGSRIQKYTVCLPACGGLIALAVFLQWSVMPQLLRLVSEGLITKD